MQVKDPSPATPRRYGLTLEEWRAILDIQGGVCAICKRVPPNGRLVVDHEHVRGWKKMPPEKRKLYVRGLICSWDNRQHLRRGMTAQKASAIMTYLRMFEERRPC